jgi:hypothetical protein
LFNAVLETRVIYVQGFEEWNVEWEKTLLSSFNFWREAHQQVG